MNKVYCDRCGKECVEGGAYYVIRTYGLDVNPTNDGKTSLDAATQNMATNILIATNQEKHYCKSCKDDILSYMIKKPESASDQVKPAEQDNLASEFLNSILKKRRDL